MQTFTLKTRNINSDVLFKEIGDFIEGIIVNFSITCNLDGERDAILEIIDELMEDMIADGKIDQWNVICDRRNNKPADLWNKSTHLEITYRQVNCYNTTELHYIVKK